MNKRVYNQQLRLKVLLKNKRTCCVCHSPDKTVQVHHIDGNPANTVENNLAVLCLLHHDQATAGLVKGNVGLGVKFSPNEVRMHKSSWEKAVLNELMPQQRTAIETQNPRFEIHRAFEKAYNEHANDLGQPKGEAEPLKNAYLAQYDKAQVIWNENAAELYRLHMKKGVWVAAKDLLDDDLTWLDDAKNSERFSTPQGKLPPWGGPARLRSVNPKDWSIGNRRWHFYHIDGATFVQRFEKGFMIGPFRRFWADKDGAQVYALTGDGTDNQRWHTSVLWGVSDLISVDPMNLVPEIGEPQSGAPANPSLPSERLSVASHTVSDPRQEKVDGWRDMIAEAQSKFKQSGLSLFAILEQDSRFESFKRHLSTGALQALRHGTGVRSSEHPFKILDEETTRIEETWGLH